MNNEYKKNNSVAKGGSRAPFHHPLQDDQDYAHKNFSAQGSPSGHLGEVKVQGRSVSQPDQSASGCNIL